MESRAGSVYSGRGFSPDVRGRSLKSSPFCPPSSSKLSQSIIKDHMVSHYKKVYSAKAAIDTSTPKSLLYSVKYNDQIKRDQLRRRSRPQSAPFLSHRSSRVSCSSAQSRSSVCGDQSPYFGSRSSMISSPRFTTTFHTNDVVYSSCKINANRTRPASEMKYRSTEAASHRRQSTNSLQTLEDQSMYRTFQDPVQKTYSGDLLQKHSHHFTKDKPFTPKMLKSDKSSYLSKYRYYRAPHKKTPLDSKNTPQESHGRTKLKQDMQDLDESSQVISGNLDSTTEHDDSEAELSGTFLSSLREQNLETRSRDFSFFNDLPSSFRTSPDDKKTPKIRSVSAEEEIKYLEFISAVTEDILSRGHISDRVINRIFQRHLDMNLHKLDEGKMRHLLEVLHKDVNGPTELDKKKENQMDSLLLHLESGGKGTNTKAEKSTSRDVSLEKCKDLSDHDGPLLVSTLLGSPEGIASPKIYEGEDKEDVQSKGSISSLLNEPVTNIAGTSDDTMGCFGDEKHEDTNETDEQDPADAALNEQPEELEDLAVTLSESLHVSSNTHKEEEGRVTENPNTVSPVSDDEF